MRKNTRRHQRSNKQHKKRRSIKNHKKGGSCGCSAAASKAFISKEPQGWYAGGNVIIPLNPRIDLDPNNPTNVISARNTPLVRNGGKRKSRRNKLGGGFMGISLPPALGGIVGTPGLNQSTNADPLSTFGNLNGVNNMANAFAGKNPVNPIVNVKPLV